MNIGAIGNTNTLFHVNGVNQSAARQRSTTGVAQQADRDKLTLTPQGKKQSLLSNLMKQRENLIQRKGELMAENAEKGGSTMDIKNQMDLIEEQLKNLDDQISKATTEEMEPDKEEKTDSIYDKPKTKEEVQSEQLSSITQMASSMDAVDVITSVKSRVDGEANVVRAEIKSGFGNMEVKAEQLSELESKSSELLERTGEYIHEANGEVSDVREPVETEETDLPEDKDTSRMWKTYEDGESVN